MLLAGHLKVSVYAGVRKEPTSDILWEPLIIHIYSWNRGATVRNIRSGDWRNWGKWAGVELLITYTRRYSVVDPICMNCRLIYSGGLLHHHNLWPQIGWFLGIPQRRLLIGWLLWLTPNAGWFSVMQFDFLLQYIQCVTFSHRLLDLCFFST